MTSIKKQRKTIDQYVGVIVVVPASERAVWKLAADRAGMSVNEWARDRLNRIVPGGSVR